MQYDLFNNYVISDYIFEKDKIFAYLNLQDDELKLYEKIISFIERNIPKPDLVIYIQSDLEQIVKNIKKRNRSFESNISEEYLKELIEAYNYFFFRYKSCPLLIVNCNTLDFVNNKNDFDLLFDNIFKPTRLPIEYLNPIINL
jgi:deoxyadenosine/deoxycytidine kinase